MSPFKNPKSPSTPASVHRIASKAKLAKDKAAKTVATAARVGHVEQADFHLTLAQVAAGKEATLNREIIQETSLQGICKESSESHYKLDISSIARLLVSDGYNEDVTNDVVPSCANLVVDVCMNLCAVTLPQLKRGYSINPRTTSSFESALAMAEKHKMLVLHVDGKYWFNDTFYSIMNATKGEMNEEA